MIKRELRERFDRGWNIFGVGGWLGEDTIGSDVLPVLREGKSLGAVRSHSDSDNLFQSQYLPFVCIKEQQLQIHIVGVSARITETSTKGRNSQPQ